MKPCLGCPHSPPSSITQERVLKGAWVPCNDTVEPCIDTAKNHHVRVAMMRRETECIAVREWRKGIRT